MKGSSKTKANKPVRVAVVDIGSNSVRLVIYRCANGEHKIVKDKKATCRLALGMHHAHPELNPRGIAAALKTLKQFRGLIEKNDVACVIAIATAALRAVAKTAGGRDFHQRAEQALRHPIKIISGKEEAQLTALGVMSALPKAAGVCGDLGGGSLELASIRQGRVRKTTTAALGTLTLLSETRGDPLLTEHLVGKRLGQIAWLRRAEGKVFYAIGGSWRAVGCIMMKMQGGKARPIHGFTIKKARAHKYASDIALLPIADFKKMPKKISQRADIMPMAAATLVQLIAIMNPDRIVFSGRGVREGLVRRWMKTPPKSSI